MELPLQTKIARSSDKTYKFATVTAKFGEGYEESRPSGINYFAEDLTINWVGLTQAEKISLEVSITSGGSWQIYTYMPCFDIVPKTFRITKGTFKTNHTGNSAFTASVTLIQCFDFT
jgi:phage-related protein